MSSQLFTPFTLRNITFRNRVGVSPMCQYSVADGVPGEWHHVHLGSRAVGGAGLIIAEASAVVPEGRITPGDTGIWSDAQVSAWRPITKFIAEHGAVPGIQLAHAGRKASCELPQNGGKRLAADKGGWQPMGPTSEPFYPEETPPPKAMTERDLASVIEAFAAAAHRALAAGFKFVEIHGAHGYLLHSLYSPLSNHRSDQYGGSFENRTRLIREIARRLRREIGNDVPLLARLSCSDWTDGGWTIDDSVKLAIGLKEDGVDLVDCSSGGNISRAKIPNTPGYQVPFAEAIRKAGVPTAAVGLITQPAQAEAIIASGQADLVLLARESLRDPYWPLHTAKALGVDLSPITPQQYARAF